MKPYYLRRTDDPIHWFLRLLLWFEKWEPGTMTRLLRQARQPYDVRIFYVLGIPVSCDALHRAGFFVRYNPHLTIRKPIPCR